MSAPDIRSEILEVIDGLPEHVLLEILAYLKQLQLDADVKKILSENAGLLKRLADNKSE